MMVDQDGRSAPSYPNFSGKHGLRAFVDPMDTIEYARAHGDLDGYATLRGIVLTYQRSILQHVYKSEGLDPATTEKGYRGILTLPSTDHEVGAVCTSISVRCNRRMRWKCLGPYPTASVNRARN